MLDYPMTRRFGGSLGLVLLAIATAVVAAARADELEVPLPPAPADEMLVSPIASFRELLALSPEEQAQALADKSPARQVVLAEKLKEYRELPEAVRERRLYATELSWYLRPLLGMETGLRGEALARVPVEFQQPVRDQLEQWDKLPPDLREELVANQSELRLLVRWPDSISAELEVMTQRMSPTTRRRIQQKMVWWERLSHQRRQLMVNQFQRFFTLTPKEQEKALGRVPLSEREKAEIQETLDQFAELEPGQRSICLRSYARFASLSSQERIQFLRNAELWQEMSPEDRRSWRRLLADIQVLTPPGIGNPPLPPPLNAIGSNTPRTPPMPR